MSTFRNWTDAQVATHNAKVAGVKAAPAGRTTSEARLHDEIAVECKRRGWYFVHARMDRATTTAKGVPDFIIAAPDGRTYWIEAKGGKTKLTREQFGALHWLWKLGHRTEIVRSMEAFLEAIRLDELGASVKDALRYAAVRRMSADVFVALTRSIVAQHGSQQDYNAAFDEAVDATLEPKMNP